MKNACAVDEHIATFQAVCPNLRIRISIEIAGPPLDSRDKSAPQIKVAAKSSDLVTSPNKPARNMAANKAMRAD
ncbi:MAG: hypothetical protein Pyrs2KO_16590 [Pyruvatibacter sp.]